MSLQALIQQANNRADKSVKAGFFRRLTDRQLLGRLNTSATAVIEGLRAEYKNGRISDPGLQDALRELGRLSDEAKRRSA